MGRSTRQTTAAVAAAFVLAVLAPLVSLAGWGPPAPVSSSGRHVGVGVAGEQAVLAPRRAEHLLAAGLAGGHERVPLPTAALLASCAAGMALLGLVLSPPGRHELAPVRRFLLWLRAPPGA